MAPWRMLTGRGWAFLVFGLLGTVASLYFGQRDLAWLTLLMFLLPIICLIVVGRTRLHLSVQRSISPGRIVLGEGATASIELNKRGYWPSGLLRFEESVPRELGRRPRFNVHQVAGEWHREISYPLTGLARGRHKVGPLLVRSSDPFGLSKSDHRFRSSQELMVTPAVVPLSAMSSAAGINQTGDSNPQRIGLVGADDVLIREYRHGDDVRRVHWKSSAKKGEFMVRREEQAWDPAITMVLDNRQSAHAGSGRESSFEYAVSVAASVANHMISNGFRITFVDASGYLVEPGISNPAMAREATTIALTDERLNPQHTDLKLAAETCHAARTGEMLVAIMGRLTLADVDAMATMRARRAQGMIFLLDVDSFAPRRSRGTAEQADEHEQAAELLRRDAWRVVDCRRGTPIDGAWRELDRIGAAL